MTMCDDHGQLQHQGRALHPSYILVTSCDVT